MPLSQYTIALEAFVLDQEIAALTAKQRNHRPDSEVYDYYSGKISSLKRHEMIYAERIIRTRQVFNLTSPENSGIRAYQDPLDQQRRLE